MLKPATRLLPPRNIFLLEIPVRDLMMMKMIRLVRSGAARRPWMVHPKLTIFVGKHGETIGCLGGEVIGLAKVQSFLSNLLAWLNCCLWVQLLFFVCHVCDAVGGCRMQNAGWFSPSLSGSPFGRPMPFFCYRESAHERVKTIDS